MRDMDVGFNSVPFCDCIQMSEKSLSHRTARTPRRPPTCDPAITPDIFRCFRFGGKRAEATTPGATAPRVSSAFPGIPRRHGAPDAHPLAYPNSAQAISGTLVPAGASWRAPGELSGAGEDVVATLGCGRLLQQVAGAMPGTGAARPG